MSDEPPWSIEETCLEYCYTKYVSHIGECTYILKVDGPPSIEHRCLEYHYTKLGSSSRYSTMHIYA